MTSRLKHHRNEIPGYFTHQGRPLRTRRPRVRSLLLIPRWLRRSRDPFPFASLRLCAFALRDPEAHQPPVTNSHVTPQAEVIAHRACAGGRGAGFREGVWGGRSR
jgi:hypothetical protein